ncbi:unnamed protein product [Mycetohabitans rhizoxinica HKI 454]|uniref:Uncharacterized protein n=1 Tax=Mycetohabitans rhizoxinica (strain DSM 19002 / CIP 109453 / HKI 454) TaxID=882378 RepID=E5AT57_MYCRK|nr:unnamed protein product [Mycetohabitans rhizoxinica HKI 454]
MSETAYVNKRERSLANRPMRSGRRIGDNTTL